MTTLEARTHDIVERTITLCESLIRVGPTDGAAFPPLLVGIHADREEVAAVDKEDRLKAARLLADRGAEAIVLAYDGYVTQADPTEPCPECLGQTPQTATPDCPSCRGFGGTSVFGRREALMVLCLRKHGPTTISTRPYTRVAGTVLFQERFDVTPMPGATMERNVFANVFRRS